MRLLLLILLVTLSTRSEAQRRYVPLDSTRTFFPITYGSRVWKPMIALDAFRSYYSGSPIAFNGLRVGAEYRGTHRFGIGIYLLKKDVVFSGIHVDSPYATDTSLVKYKMKFMSL